MFENLKAIKLSGAIFNTITTLNFFDNNKKGALLFGRNGTGKSTIAKAFRKLAGEEISTIIDAAFIDNSDTAINLDEESKRHIFIFDEDYVDKNVKLQRDHLETIVMLGPAADLAEQISAARANLEEARIIYKRQIEVVNEYLNEANIKSPAYHINRIADALRGNENWAGRDSKIKGNRQNSNVNNETYKQFINISPSKSKTILQDEFNKKLKFLEDVRNGNLKINATVPTVPHLYTEYNDAIIQDLLASKIESPELSERDLTLLTLLKNIEARKLSDRLDTFQNKEITKCPYCLQALAPEYKESLVRIIKSILNKTVKDHQNLLKNNIIELLSLNLEPFKNINGYQKCVDLVQKINDIFQINNNNLENKYENPYVPISSNSNVAPVIAQLVEALLDLDESVKVYNNEIANPDPIIAELTCINNEIAHYEIEDLVKQFDKQEKEFEEAKELCKTLGEEYNRKRTIFEELEAERRNVRIAVDEINACMAYIFFANDRLKIEYVDGAYKLLSRGTRVKPSQVSASERNIIGLSYFFTSILEGMEESEAYLQDYLIIIDDPLSSYDMENKVGIISFLKYKLGLFLGEGSNTKVLIMTHDLITHYDISQISHEIFGENGYNRFELINTKLYPFTNRRHEYTEIAKIIYTYALDGNTDNNYALSIGNMMRQLLEAFLTFLYRRGINNISASDILELLPEEYRLYYQNLVCRLVLHGGSHRQEQVKAMTDFQFFSLISDDEKKRTAKEILCFIYLLNKRHLLAHLKDCEDAEAEIESWCQHIASQARNMGHG